MNQEGMLKPALIGGILLGLLSALPFLSLFNCLCCAWVIGGGVLASHLYVKNSRFPVTLGTGIVLGLFTGAIGAVVDTLFTIPLDVVLSNMGLGFAEQAQQLSQQLPNIPPEMREALRYIGSGGGFGIALILFTGLLKLVIYSLIAMLGGALGVALFEKRKPQERPPAYTPPAEIPPPPPPPPSGE